MFVAYIFEAKQLQAFIFETSKLRDASGGSELLNKLAFEAFSGPESIPKDLAAMVLKAAGLADKDVRVYRRAGGVLSFVVAESLSAELYQFRTLWRLSVAAFAPGLAAMDGVGKGPDQPAANAAARAAMLASPAVFGNHPPFSAPLVRLSSRSAQAPTPEGEGIKNQTCKITGEFIDEPTRAKRQFLKQHDLLLPYLFVGPSAKDYKWPLRFDDEKMADEADAVFPFLKGRPKRVAIIHIDGNGVGQIFAKANQSLSGEKPRELSRALARATQEATQQAMAQTVLPFAVDKVVPARPVLIGGDDLTLVLRADLAVNFVQAYIKLFEEKTLVAFENFKEADLPKGLKAKAGIVFLGVRQPFAQGYKLCESLANAAKDEQHSRVSFVRLTNAFIPHSAREVRNLRGKLWRDAWGMDELVELGELVALLADEDVGRGALRRVPTLLALEDLTQAHAVYKRALLVLKKRNQDQYKKVLAALERYGLTDDSAVNTHGYSPLLDAHDLGQVARLESEGQA